MSSVLFTIAKAYTLKRKKYPQGLQFLDVFEYISTHFEWQKHMLVCDYMVEQIDGDYAHLRRVDEPDGELKLVARALLPMEITEGSRLHYELMQYTLIG